MTKPTCHRQFATGCHGIFESAFFVSPYKEGSVCLVCERQLNPFLGARLQTMETIVALCLSHKPFDIYIFIYFNIRIV